MSISALSDKTVSIPTPEPAHRYTRKYVEYGLTRLNQSDSFTQRIAQYYTTYFKECPFYDPIDENRHSETRCSVSGKETATCYECHDIPLISGFPGPGLRICLEKGNEKVRDVVFAFFKNLRRDMGPYICYTEGPFVPTIWKEDIPDLNIPHSQEKHILYKIGIDYRKEELRIICEVWKKGLTQDFPLSSLIRTNQYVSFSQILDTVIPDSFMGVYIKNVLLKKEARYATSSMLKEQPVTIPSKKRKETSITSHHTSRVSSSLTHPSSQGSTIEHPIPAEQSEVSKDSTSKKPKTPELSTPVLSAPDSLKTSAITKIATTVALETAVPLKIFPKETESSGWTEKSFGPFIIRGASGIVRSPNGSLWTIKHTGNKLVAQRPQLKNEGKHAILSWVVNRVATIQIGNDLIYIATPKFKNLSVWTPTKDNEYMIVVHGSSDASEIINAVFA